jgi:hypothetical protein
MTSAFKAGRSGWPSDAKMKAHIFHAIVANIAGRQHPDRASKL